MIHQSGVWAGDVLNANGLFRPRGLWSSRHFFLSDYTSALCLGFQNRIMNCCHMMFKFICLTRSHSILLHVQIPFVYISRICFLTSSPDVRALVQAIPDPASLRQHFRQHFQRRRTHPLPYHSENSAEPLQHVHGFNLGFHNGNQRCGTWVSAAPRELAPQSRTCSSCDSPARTVSPSSNDVTSR